MQPPWRYPRYQPRPTNLQWLDRALWTVAFIGAGALIVIAVALLATAL